MPYIGKTPTAVPLTSSDITDGIITSAKISDGTIATADISDSAVTKAKTSGVVSDPFRNIIINGDMSIAQRGTSATGLTNGNNGYHTIDRYRFSELSAPSFAFTQSQSTTVPSGQGFSTSLKMDCTTAQGSLGAGDGLRIQQRLEGQNLQYLKKGTSSAQSLTLSFWVRSAKTGTYIAELFDNDNTRYISQSYTISSADTWEKKTLTYAGDTSGTLGNDNAESLTLNFWLASGTTYTSGTLGTSWHTTGANRAVGQVNLADSTSNDWYVTGVQLEAGTSASDFEFLPHEVNFQRCQRYFFKLIDVPSGDSSDYFCSGFYYSGGTFYAWIDFPTMMRTAPTLSVASGSNYYIIYRNGGADNVDDFDLSIGRTNGGLIRNNTDASGTGGHAGGVHSTSNSKITFTAEL